MEAIEEAKKETGEASVDGKEDDVITASPLDYHVFRQEITSKYPAYVPPRPSIPLEAEQASLLPPLPNHPTRNNGSNGILPAPANAQSGGASILHQPVHIATPAPSPPPSPGVGGKAGKKQNYQTNQNFPFMYPPLDGSSNSAGGKGGAGLQDLLVGRKWEGSDIPASILEAGELFSRRVRMTRATRQLWEEREKFLKFERGWDPEEDSDDEIEALDLDGLTMEEKEEIEKVRAENRRETFRVVEPDVDYGTNKDQLSDKVKERLVAVEHFYVGASPSHFPGSATDILIARSAPAPAVPGHRPIEGHLDERNGDNDAGAGSPVSPQHGRQRRRGHGRPAPNTTTGQPRWRGRTARADAGGD
jgi:hypothetical protein